MAYPSPFNTNRYPPVRKGDASFRGFALSQATSAIDPNSLITASSDAADGFISLTIDNPTTGTHLPNGGAAVWTWPLVDLFGNVVSSMATGQLFCQVMIEADGILPANISACAGVYGGGAPESSSGGGWAAAILGTGATNFSNCFYAPGSGNWQESIATTGDASGRRVRAGPGWADIAQARTWWHELQDVNGAGVEDASRVVLQNLQGTLDRAFLAVGWTTGSGSVKTIRVRPMLGLITTTYGVENLKL